VTHRGQGPGARSQPGAGRATISIALVALVWLGAACTDPRPRPAPPTIRLTLSSTALPTSPGDILGSLYLYDANGIASVRMRLDLSNGQVLGDSAVVPSDPFEMTRSVQWHLQGGIPAGTRVQIVVRAVNYIGFEAADTVVTAVSDSAGSRR
jgi:hypothetical protein